MLVVIRTPRPRLSAIGGRLERAIRPTSKEIYRFPGEPSLLQVGNPLRFDIQYNVLFSCRGETSR